MSIESYFLFFTAAFLASLSHCVGMCGGIVVGLNMCRFGDSRAMQALANVLYFCGRACSYMVVGLCVVLIGKGFGFSQNAKAFIFIMLGILLFITAFLVTFYPKILSALPSTSKFGFYTKAFKNALQSQSVVGFFIVGILNGLLPCHLVYMFALKAADSLSIWHALFGMFLFSLATFLPLFLVGFLSQQILNSSLRRIFLYVAFAIMSYFAVMNVYKGVQLLQNDSMNMHEIHHTMPHSNESQDMTQKKHIDSKHTESMPHNHTHEEHNHSADAKHNH